MTRRAVGRAAGLARRVTSPGVRRPARRAAGVGASLLAALLATGSGAAAQTLVEQQGAVTTVRNDPFAAAYRVDFAIPDAPAFKLLDVDPSDLLRPQTVRELALAFAEFRGENGALTIPRAFAVEVSPGLLVGARRLRAYRYNRQKLLYSIRLSGATRRDSAGAPPVLGAGVRVSLVDEQDLRTDTAYATGQHVTDLTEKMLRVFREARRRTLPPEPIVLTPEEEEQLRALNDEIRTRWAERYWNADVLEVAAGTRVRSADSLGRDPKVDEVALWGTYAKGIGEWGQALFGVRYGSARDSAADGRRQTGSGSFRLYLGSNRLKMFVEAQQGFREGERARRLLNSGVEVAAAGWAWANFTAGLQDDPDGGRSRVVTTFKVKTGVPRL